MPLGAVPAVVVRLLEERRFDPPRGVEVERDGYWWAGFQRAWRLCDDDRGWVAHVEDVMQHDWGRGKHLDCGPPERLRLPSDDRVPLVGCSADVHPSTFITSTGVITLHIDDPR